MRFSLDSDTVDDLIVINRNYKSNDLLPQPTNKLSPDELVSVMHEVSNLMSNCDQSGNDDVDSELDSLLALIKWYLETLKFEVIHRLVFLHDFLC